MYTVLTLLSVAWLLIENVVFVYKRKGLLYEFGITDSKLRLYSFLCLALSVICVSSMFRNHYIEVAKYIAVACAFAGSIFIYMSYRFKRVLETSGTDRAHKAMEQVSRMIFIGISGSVFSVLLLLTSSFE